ncbi:hypothetical protein CEUSTIGMA_g307.t1 [Chlamydomonas eustigma]|uniref:Uncharacterized protein n=1 Tax=Chlamydomonas eustigma TaxID=1157962 RepID=A0A250WQA8_9CHLO|nr:hypothetical protein CEUSTIGMA_g307.t1 [Chlamydomonas eustigma]|eukprot:GAX72852.1 hypothetical protein CEUSTIGMA_g307.t1 [Chlamydomonas eustigma]
MKAEIQFEVCNVASVQKYAGLARICASNDNAQDTESSQITRSCFPRFCIFVDEEPAHVQYVQLQLAEPDTGKKMLLHVPVHGAFRVLKAGRSQFKKGDPVSLPTSILGGAKCTPWEHPEEVAHETTVRSAKSGEEWLCAVKAFWDLEHPGVLFLATTRFSLPQKTSVDPDLKAWSWQALSISAHFDTISVCDISRVKSSKLHDENPRDVGPRIQSVHLQYHPEGNLIAAVVGDDSGSSCIIFLTPNLKPTSHVIWCNVEAETTGLSSEWQHRVEAAVWLLGTRCLAVMDSCGNLGLVSYTGQLAQMSISANANVQVVKMVTQVPYSLLTNALGFQTSKLDGDVLGHQYSLTAAKLRGCAKRGTSSPPSNRGITSAPTHGALIVSDGSSLTLLSYSAPPLPPLLLVDLLSSMPTSLGTSPIENSSTGTPRGAAGSGSTAGKESNIARGAASEPIKTGSFSASIVKDESSPAAAAATAPAAAEEGDASPSEVLPEVQLQLNPTRSTSIRLERSISHEATTCTSSPAHSMASAQMQTSASSLLLTMPPSPLAAMLTSQNLFSPAKLLKSRPPTKAGISERSKGWPIVHQPLASFARPQSFPLRGGVEMPSPRSHTVAPKLMYEPPCSTALPTHMIAQLHDSDASMSRPFLLKSQELSTSRQHAKSYAHTSPPPHPAKGYDQYVMTSAVPSPAESSTAHCVVMDVHAHSEMLLGDAALLEGLPVQALLHFLKGGIFGFLPCFLVLLHNLQLLPSISLIRAFSSFVASFCLPQPADDVVVSNTSGSPEDVLLPALDPQSLHRECQIRLQKALQGLLPEDCSSKPSSPTDYATAATTVLSATAELCALRDVCQQQLAVSCQCLALLSHQLHMHAVQRQYMEAPRRLLPQHLASLTGTPPKKRRPSSLLRVSLNKLSANGTSSLLTSRAHHQRTSSLNPLRQSTRQHKAVMVGLPMPVVWRDVPTNMSASSAVKVHNTFPNMDGAKQGPAMLPTLQQGTGPATTTGIHIESHLGLTDSAAAHNPSSSRCFSCTLGLYHTALDVTSMLPSLLTKYSCSEQMEGPQEHQFPESAPAPDWFLDPAFTTGLLLLAYASEHVKPDAATLGSDKQAAEAWAPHALQGLSQSTDMAVKPDPDGTKFSTSSVAGGQGHAKSVRLNWRLLHEYPAEARAAALWSFLGDWRKAAVLSFTIHQMAEVKTMHDTKRFAAAVAPSFGSKPQSEALHISRQPRARLTSKAQPESLLDDSGPLLPLSLSPRSRQHGDQCLRVGLSILRQQVARCHGMEVQEACMTLHELVAIPRHVLGPRAPVYGVMLRQVCHKLAELLPKRMGITPLIPPLPCQPKTLLRFSHQDIRNQIRAQLGQGLAKACSELQLAMGCGGIASALPDVVQAVLVNSEIVATLKMLLRWQGSYNPDQLEHDTQVACQTAAVGPSMHTDTSEWDSKKLLDALERSLSTSHLLPETDLRAAMLQARATLNPQIMHVEESDEEDCDVCSTDSVAEVLSTGFDVEIPLYVTGGRAPQQSSRRIHPEAPFREQELDSLVDLNDLALLVDVAQIGGTLLACIQPHIADSLPALETRLKEALQEGLTPLRHSGSGWVKLASLRQILTTNSVEVGPEAEEASAEEITTAVTELLHQLVCLDWALVCRVQVASALLHLQQTLPQRTGGGSARLSSTTSARCSLRGQNRSAKDGGLVHRQSASFTFKNQVLPDMKKQQQGQRLSEQQASLLRWSAALIQADWYHVDVELQATIYIALVTAAAVSAEAVDPSTASVPLSLVEAVEKALRRRNLFNAKLSEQINNLKKRGSDEPEILGGRREASQESAWKADHWFNRQMSESVVTIAPEQLTLGPAELRSQLTSSLLAGLKTFALAAKVFGRSPLSSSHDAPILRQEATSSPIGSGPQSTYSGPAGTLRHGSLLLCMLDTLAKHPAHFTGGSSVNDGQLGDMLRQELRDCFTHPLRHSEGVPQARSSSEQLQSMPSAELFMNVVDTAPRETLTSAWLRDLPVGLWSDLNSLLDQHQWLWTSQIDHQPLSKREVSISRLNVTTAHQAAPKPEGGALGMHSNTVLLAEREVRKISSEGQQLGDACDPDVSAVSSSMDSVASQSLTQQDAHHERSRGYLNSHSEMKGTGTAQWIAPGSGGDQKALSPEDLQEQAQSVEIETCRPQGMEDQRQAQGSETGSRRKRMTDHQSQAKVVETELRTSREVDQRQAQRSEIGSRSRGVKEQTKSISAGIGSQRVLLDEFWIQDDSDQTPSEALPDFTSLRGRSAEAVLSPAEDVPVCGSTASTLPTSRSMKAHGTQRLLAKDLQVDVPQLLEGVSHTGLDTSVIEFLRVSSSIEDEQYRGALRQSVGASGSLKSSRSYREFTMQPPTRVETARGISGTMLGNSRAEPDDKGTRNLQKMTNEAGGKTRTNPPRKSSETTPPGAALSLASEFLRDHQGSETPSSNGLTLPGQGASYDETNIYVQAGSLPSLSGFLHGEDSTEEAVKYVRSSMPAPAPENESYAINPGAGYFGHPGMDGGVRSRSVSHLHRPDSTSVGGTTGEGSSKAATKSSNQPSAKRTPISSNPLFGR